MLKRAHVCIKVASTAGSLTSVSFGAKAAQYCFQYSSGSSRATLAVLTATRKSTRPAALSCASSGTLTSVKTCSHASGGCSSSVCTTAASVLVRPSSVFVVFAFSSARGLLFQNCSSQSSFDNAKPWLICRYASTVCASTALSNSGSQRVVATQYRCHQLIEGLTPSAANDFSSNNSCHGSRRGSAAALIPSQPSGGAIPSRLHACTM